MQQGQRGLLAVRKGTTKGYQFGALRTVAKRASNSTKAAKTASLGKDVPSAFPRALTVSNGSVSAA